jgi:anti-sigma regulatory factor (Ser/Thr protein kinase)
MTRVRKRGEKIRQFILENVEKYPKDIASLVSQEFDISRQAVNKHIQNLVKQNSLIVGGTTRSRVYKLCPLEEWSNIYDLGSNLKEDIVWDSDIKPLIADLPENVRDIWSYGFTEMLNNSIDHSSGKSVFVNLERTAIDTEIVVMDNGEGIFKKIQRELDLHDERHAVLELAKGKLTTDPDRHSGEGIFFTSRMFDEFRILSGTVSFSHQFDRQEDWIFERKGFESGTTVLMKLNNNTSRTVKRIFDDFSSGDNYGFNKTVVPVRLAQYGNEKLFSRSQAKRLLARVDKFKVVIFDFAEVEIIGQAFADEVFRVFKNQHPEIQVMSVDASPNVQQMISRAESNDV